MEREIKTEKEIVTSRDKQSFSNKTISTDAER